MSEEVKIDQIGCARCDGEGHPDMVFKPFTFPPDLSYPDWPEGKVTHWALCPTNGEPILMGTGDIPDGVAEE